MKRLLVYGLALLVTSPFAHAGKTSDLFSRGYAVLPEPQQAVLRGGDFRFGADWKLAHGADVKSDSSAMQSLLEGLAERYHVDLARAAGKRLVIEIKPGSVKTGVSQDSDRAEIEAQAYRIQMAPGEIRLSANAEPGLFYAVQTFLQLLNSADKSLRLPEGEIVDWPDLRMRQIYWDDAHHLERVSDLKAALRQAAFFKINGFIIKLEGHFQYRSAPALVEPQALTPAEFQELTDYGLRRHVQVIPYLDAPAHIAFILKHPEYSSLRAFPESNYELCATNPDSLKLMYGMYDDLLAANKGVKYFYLSTDEAYYIGWADSAQCREAGRAKELGSRGKLLAEFVSSAANYLHDRGRTVVFWGEYPLKPDDIASLPSHIVNGETYGDAFDTEYRKHGIRQMMYNATEGEEHLFPQYFLMPATGRMHPLHESDQRIPDAVAKIVSDPARRNADLFGLVIAGWGDMGLHPETFWLGYATITSTGWNPSAANPLQSMSAFYPLFYGTEAVQMDRVYQLMSYQAQNWTDTWDVRDSTARKPIWGNSEKIFSPAHAAYDYFLDLPPALAVNRPRASDWGKTNARRLQIVAEAKAENDELMGLLHANLLRVPANRYGLEIFLAIAGLCRQNLAMIADLQSMDASLAQFDQAADKGEDAKALAAADAALARARQIKEERNAAYRDALHTWSKSWLPRVEAANGRRFLHQVDDVKDHLPDRTIDMSYLVYRELQMPFEEWYQATQTARNAFAKSHKLAEQSIPLNWEDLR